MSHARAILPGKTYLITRRTERRHFLLRPDPIINAFIRYVFIVAAERAKIMVHAFCAMSTHLHYVVTDQEGNLPEFLALFHRLVALGVQSIRNWDGAVWNRSQTSVVELCTRQAIIEKIAYTLANPVRAGLVRRARDWYGVRTTINNIGKKRWRARRPRKGLSAKNPKWAAQVEIDISLPPSIADDDAVAFRKAIRRAVQAIETVAQTSIAKESVLDAKLAMQIDPFQRTPSREATRQRNPSFAVGAGNGEARERAIRARRDFRLRYRLAFNAWRKGNRDIEFPAGTYAMRVIHGVKVAAPST